MEESKIREPVKIQVHEAYSLYYGQNRAKIGSFKRRAKGREYSCPRILLRNYFDKYVGKECVVFEGKVSVEESIFQNRDVIMIVIR